MGTYSSLCSDIVDFGTNCSNPRYSSISKITPHHMAGIWSARKCAEYHLNGGRGGASATYYIGNDGEICGGVCEERRPWTTASDYNDNRAITIEVSNNTDKDPWTVSDAAYNSLVKLCADICKRYGIEPHFDGTIYGSVTMHKQFSATACPGQELEGKIRSGEFERDVCAAMNPPQPVPPEPVKPENKPTKEPWEYGITYRTHTAKYGWFDWVGDGEMSGSQGLSLPIDAIQIEGGMESGILPVYQLNIDINGETGVCKFGEVCGAEDKGRDAYAIKVNCEKKIKYRVYRRKKGWSKWATNDQWTEGAEDKLRIEAVQIKLA